jgi:hypothetical protein
VASAVAVRRIAVFSSLWARVISRRLGDIACVVVSKTGSWSGAGAGVAGVMSERSPQHCGAEPLAQDQRNFDVETVIADRAAATFQRPVHAVLHRVGVQMKFLGRCLVA